MPSPANPLQAVFALLRLVLIGVIAIGALLFGTVVAATIFVGVTLARLFRGRSDAPPVGGASGGRAVAC